MDADQTRERVDFDHAHVAIGFVSAFILSVHGTTRTPMDVRLEPLPFNAGHGWWQIEVVGYYRDSGIPDVLMPYSVMHSFDSLPDGAEGIEVAGANRSERLPGGDLQRQPTRAATGSDVICSDWYAWHDRMPGKEPTLYVTGHCRTGWLGCDVSLTESDTPAAGTTLVLRVTADCPDFAAPADLPYEVRFEKSTDATYDSIVIEPEGITVKVQQVSRQ